MRMLGWAAVATVAAAAVGCAGADIDAAKFRAVKRVAIACCKAPTGVVVAANAGPVLSKHHGSADTDGGAANTALAEELRSRLSGWGHFEVVPAADLDGCVEYQALGTSSRGYESYAGTRMLAGNNGAVITKLFEQTQADALIFADWTWMVDVFPSGTMGMAPEDFQYNGQLQVVMVDRQGTQIWFSRSKWNASVKIADESEQPAARVQEGAAPLVSELLAEADAALAAAR